MHEAARGPHKAFTTMPPRPLFAGLRRTLRRTPAWVRIVALLLVLLLSEWALVAIAYSVRASA